MNNPGAVCIVNGLQENFHVSELCWISQDPSFGIWVLVYPQSLRWCLRSLSMFWSGFNSEIQDGLTGNITPWKTLELFLCCSIPISGHFSMFDVRGHIFLLLLLLLGHGETSQRFFAAAQPLLLHTCPFIRLLTQFFPFFLNHILKLSQIFSCYQAFSPFFTTFLWINASPSSSFPTTPPVLLQTFQPRDGTMFSALPPVPHC